MTERARKGSFFSSREKYRVLYEGTALTNEREELHMRKIKESKLFQEIFYEDGGYVILLGIGVLVYLWYEILMAFM